MRGLLYMGAPAQIGALFVVFFTLLFLGLIYAVYRRSAREEMNRAAHLPLSEEL